MYLIETSFVLFIKKLKWVFCFNYDCIFFVHTYDLNSQMYPVLMSCNLIISAMRIAILIKVDFLPHNSKPMFFDVFFTFKAHVFLLSWCLVCHPASTLVVGSTSCNFIRFLRIQYFFFKYDIKSWFLSSKYVGIDTLF